MLLGALGALTIACVGVAEATENSLPPIDWLLEAKGDSVSRVDWLATAGKQLPEAPLTPAEGAAIYKLINALPQNGEVHALLDTLLEKAFQHHKWNPKDYYWSYHPEMRAHLTEEESSIEYSKWFDLLEKMEVDEAEVDAKEFEDYLQMYRDKGVKISNRNFFLKSFIYNKRAWGDPVVTPTATAVQHDGPTTTVVSEAPQHTTKKNRVAMLINKVFTRRNLMILCALLVVALGWALWLLVSIHQKNRGKRATKGKTL